MGRLLITLRHPGPTQVIASLLPTLKTRYDQVAVVASDTALLQLQEKHHRSMAGVELYYSQNGAWIRLSETSEKELVVSGDVLEFESPYENGYIELVHHFSNFLKEYRPDIVLRTTPAFKWGLDEALVDACLQAGLSCAFRCYQEYYGCGINLKGFPAIIGTIDNHARTLLAKKQIPSNVIGWLNQTLFESYRPYMDTRILTRTQLGLSEKDIAVLYCTVASGNIEAELDHFQCFIQAAKGKRMFIKFHPRNKPHERTRYLARVGNQVVYNIDSLPMDGVLAFPDFLISAASAINLDMLEYQVMARLLKLHGMSIFTKGPITETILLSALGEDGVSINHPGMGSCIVNEDHYDNIFESTTDREKAWLYDQAKCIFGDSADSSIQRFLSYLEKA